ncbi:MAG: Crp/Fnr family transcriptional regulator [Eggerthellaceae bacterium]|nr:Crp/Fnr family transcriptional regulator [Eggerthellaceae bacterium]
MDCRFLTKTMLFQGITEDEIRAMMGCLNARELSFDKGERIMRMGDYAREVGLVLTGSVRIESVDSWGTVTVMAHKPAGAVFAEAYACAPDTPLLVDVVAAQKCTILLIEMARLVKTCPSTCGFHSRMLQNLLSILAHNNLELSNRALATSPKTIRGKVLAYLSLQAQRACSMEFDIPFNRQQLADYLGVDRSALSAELSRMQRDGIVEVDRSRFRLIEM